ncbi:MAG TPA: phospholipase D family protein [Eoetvoesiella sp.]
MNVSTRAALCIFSLCLCIGLIGGCNPLPSLENRSQTIALPEAEAESTRLGNGISPQAEQHPGKSGIYSLSNARDAFAARALLAQAAERTLDIQYYIWRNDLTGTLLFEALHAAADRGVRVRLLLDDNNTSGLDTTLAALDAHPNIEVRLFNPFTIRKPRWIGYVTDFSRANRRMHNKSFTADNQATIIGGRNVGDEYFGATDGVLFADLDVLAVGPVVNEVSNDFDRYWASDSSYPVTTVLPYVDSAELKKLATEASLVERNPAAAAYIAALHNSALIHGLMNGTLQFEWATARLVSDDPGKGLALASPDKLLTHELSQIIGNPESELDLVSPYFVPGAAGVDAFAAMAQKGVQIKILTNSLDATDVAAVHAGYAKRRKPLLKAGIHLYEMRRLSPESEKNKNTGPFGSSGSSLHAKTFSVDRSRVFVGSFNFDPRSAKLNTELGLVIESPALAMQIAAAFDKKIRAAAYEVRLSDTGRLYWLEQVNGKSVRHDTEPGTSFWQRAGVKLLSLLPIEWLL